MYDPVIANNGHLYFFASNVLTKRVEICRVKIGIFNKN
jgi:hypothetical protein